MPIVGVVAELLLLEFKQRIRKKSLACTMPTMTLQFIPIVNMLHVSIAM